MKKKILIVDDHPVVVLALKILLEKSGFEVIGETNNGVDALKLTRELSPHAIILDIDIPQIDGLEVIERAQKIPLCPPILVLTAQPSEHFVLRCITAGAAGFISKNKDLVEVSSALNAVISGHSYFPLIRKNKNTQVDINESDLIKKLSTREMSVLRQLSLGLTNNEIAEKMLLSNKTISTYKTRIFEKLNIRNIVDIIEFSKRNNLV